MKYPISIILGENMIKANIKVKILEESLEKLQVENEALVKENQDLKEQLTYEKNKPSVGYEKAESLISELEKYIELYKKLISSLYSKHEEYEKKLKEFSDLKKQYKKEMKKLLKELKK